MATATSSSFGLFLAVREAGTAAAGLQLAVAGSAASGEFAGITLHTFSDESGQTPTASLPLFLAGAGDDRTTKNLNLWVGGRAHDAAGATTLFVANTQSGVFDSVPMYVSGDGTNAGWLPSDTSLNLVLARDPAGATTLFCQGPGTPQTSGVPLYVLGGFGADSGVPLSVPGVIGFSDKGARLFTSGW